MHQIGPDNYAYINETFANDDIMKYTIIVNNIISECETVVIGETYLYPNIIKLLNRRLEENFAKKKTQNTYTKPVVE